MNVYEVVIILRKKLTPEDQKKEIDAVGTLIKTTGGTLSEAKLLWENRVLAYPLGENETHGHYWLLTVSLPQSAVKDVSQKLIQNNAVLRHLITRKD